MITLPSRIVICGIFAVVIAFLPIQLNGLDNALSSVSIAKIGSNFFNPQNWLINEDTGVATSAFPVDTVSEGNHQAFIISLNLSQISETQSLVPALTSIPMPENTKRIMARNSDGKTDDVFFIGKDFLQFNTVSSNSALKTSFRIDKSGRYGDLNFLECSPKFFENKIVVSFGGKSITTIVKTIGDDAEGFSEFAFESETSNVWRPDIVSSDSHQSIVAINSVSQRDGAFLFEAALLRMINSGSSELIRRFNDNTRIAGSTVSDDGKKVYLLLLNLVEDSKISIEVAEFLPSEVSLRQVGKLTFQDDNALAYMFLPWNITFSENSVIFFPLPNLKFGGKLNLSSGGWAPFDVALPKDVSVVTAFYKNDAVNVIAGTSGKSAIVELPRLSLYKFPFLKNE